MSPETLATLSNEQIEDLKRIAKDWQDRFVWTRSDYMRQFYVEHTHPGFLEALDRRYALCQGILDA